MKTVFGLLLLLLTPPVWGQNNDTNASKNLRQYYSGKFGYYHPDPKLNNGLLFGVDGITEFVKYDFCLSGAVDFYQKQTFNFFTAPEPDVSRQALILLPLHANIGYKLFEVSDADTRMFIGGGGGYYFYFYSVEYNESSSSGGLFPVITLTPKSETKNGGNLFGTAYARMLIGKIFIEPRFYFASPVEEKIGSYAYTINPSGFAVTLGFQY
ncbi:MAG: hypothetical protein WCT99_13115 [Bacteroidota bacterium]|jgi:hypothetical protein